MIDLSGLTNPPPFLGSLVDQNYAAQKIEKKYVQRLVEKHVAKAIEEYEKSRANLDSARSLGGNPGNAGGTVNV
ncbi:hypothetical protein Tco_0966762 [Tanacetum coccineum]